MCFSAETSLTTFLISILTSSILIKSAKGTHKATIQIIGYFFIYIAVVQFLEYLMWIDLSCSQGLNQFASMIIPYIVYLQPVVLFLLAKNIKGKVSNFLMFLNILYLLIVLVYLNKNPNWKCSQPNINRHLQWNTLYHNLPLIASYLALAIINIFGVLDFTYAWFTFSVLAISYLYSYFYVYQTIGELWCFLGALLPLVIYIYRLLLKKPYF